MLESGAASEHATKHTQPAAAPAALSTQEEDSEGKSKPRQPVCVGMPDEHRQVHILVHSLMHSCDYTPKPH